MGYYRGGKKNKEIDIVVDNPNIKNILIEVKYREQAPISDIVLPGQCGTDFTLDHTGRQLPV